MESLPRITQAKNFPSFEQEKARECHFYHKHQNLHAFLDQCASEGIDQKLKQIKQKISAQITRKDWTALLRYIRFDPRDSNRFRTFALILKMNRSKQIKINEQFSFKALLIEVISCLGIGDLMLKERKVYANPFAREKEDFDDEKIKSLKQINFLKKRISKKNDRVRAREVDVNVSIHKAKLSEYRVKTHGMSMEECVELVSLDLIFALFPVLAKMVVRMLVIETNIKSLFDFSDLDGGKSVQKNEIINLAESPKKNVTNHVKTKKKILQNPFSSQKKNQTRASHTQSNIDSLQVNGTEDQTCFEMVYGKQKKKKETVFASNQKKNELFNRNLYGIKSDRKKNANNNENDLIEERNKKAREEMEVDEYYEKKIAKLIENEENTFTKIQMKMKLTSFKKSREKNEYIFQKLQKTSKQQPSDDPFEESLEYLPELQTLIQPKTQKLKKPRSLWTESQLKSQTLFEHKQRQYLSLRRRMLKLDRPDRVKIKDDSMKTLCLLRPDKKLNLETIGKSIENSKSASNILIVLFSKINGFNFVIDHKIIKTGIHFSTFEVKAFPKKSVKGRFHFIIKCESKNIAREIFGWLILERFYADFFMLILSKCNDVLFSKFEKVISHFEKQEKTIEEKLKKKKNRNKKQKILKKNRVFEESTMIGRRVGFVNLCLESKNNITIQKEQTPIIEEEMNNKANITFESNPISFGLNPSKEVMQDQNNQNNNVYKNLTNNHQSIQEENKQNDANTKEVFSILEKILESQILTEEQNFDSTGIDISDEIKQGKKHVLERLKKLVLKGVIDNDKASIYKSLLTPKIDDDEPRRIQEETDHVSYIKHSPSEHLNIFKHIFPFNFEIINNALLKQSCQLKMTLSQQATFFEVQYLLNRCQDKYFLKLIIKSSNYINALRIAEMRLMFWLARSKFFEFVTLPQAVPESGKEYDPLLFYSRRLGVQLLEKKVNLDCLKYNRENVGCDNLGQFFENEEFKTLLVWLIKKYTGMSLHVFNNINENSEKIILFVVENNNIMKITCSGNELKDCENLSSLYFIRESFPVIYKRIESYLIFRD